ncbi:MAG TPA: nucleotidyltransferase domain-containing protein [Thermomicrobiales bacterium]|nr:nucleotidyltransferase domain-containing protein [Thermomicrobiales bacterium]
MQKNLRPCKRRILPDMDQTIVDRDIARLLHIRDAIARIEEYAAAGHEQFLVESMTQAAILRQLEIVCEAAKRLSPELRRRHAEFPWGRLRVLQDEFDHHFLELDLNLVWDVTLETIPHLKRMVEAVLDEAAPAEDTGSVMAIDALLIDNRAEILRIAKEHGALSVRIFGSFAKGTAGPNSDVDVLVDLEPGRSLFDLIGIKHGIEDLLGRAVHIVTEEAISPYLREDIIRSAAPL